MPAARRFRPPAEWNSRYQTVVNPKLIGNRSKARSVQAAFSYARFVNESGGENVRIAVCCQDRECVLVALLESAAVGDPAERARNELRVLHITEGPEHLVAFIHIVVNARVKSVAVFAEDRI